MKPVYIAGTFMTHFGKRPDVSLKQLVKEAVEGVLRDANAQASQIEVAFFANGFQDFVEGQTNIPGQIALRAAGLHSLPIVNIENACASGSTAVWLAMRYLQSGAGDIALAVGAEKMHYQDAEHNKRVMEAFRGGMDIHQIDETFERLMKLGGKLPPSDVEIGHRTAFMDLYAAMCRAGMKKDGCTQRQIAAVASKNHAHSVYNPNAQFQKPFSIDEVLASRPLSFPLTVLMCSPFSDGAAAAILCTKRGAEKLNLAGAPIKILAHELVSGADREWDDVQNSGVYRAAQKAYTTAGIGPEDIDLAEVHDATAWGEIAVLDKLGFCKPGEAGLMAESGATSIGGHIPVNPSGGLESRGHPIAATGLAQLYELTTQLRGQAGRRQVEGARIALQENGGGFLGVEEGAAIVSILERSTSWA